MTQQDITLDQSLNIISDEIKNNWKLSFHLNDTDYNSKKREAVEQKQQELEDKFINFYRAKLLKITDFPQKEKLFNDLILKIEELKISLKGSSQKYPDSNSIAYRELVCDSIKTKLLQEKEELKKEKLEEMNKKTELLLTDFLVNSQAKKDPLKNLLKSIIKPWKVEFFPSELNKEDMFVENFIKDKKLRFLKDIKTLILGFSKDEISQTISLFQNSKKLLSSFYSQDSQGYKIRNNLVSDIIQILRQRDQTVQKIDELKIKEFRNLSPRYEISLSLEIDISKPFQNYIDSIIKLNNESFPDQENLKKSPYSFVFGYLKELTDDNFKDKNSNYCKMCLFYYSALTLSQSLKGENQDGSPSQEQLINDLCGSFDQFNDVLTDQEREIFKRSVVENFSITDINILIAKFQQELTKSNENQQEPTIYPRNPETLKNILTRLEYFKKYLEEAENNLNYQLYTELSKDIINSKSETKLTLQQKEDFNRYLDLIIIEDPNIKAQLNKDFTLKELYLLRFKYLTSEILNTQNTEKLNSIIVNKIEDFLLQSSQNSTLQRHEDVYLKHLLDDDQIMDKFVEKLKANKELNSETMIILSGSLGNPNPLEAILLKAIERKHSAKHMIQPSKSITSVSSSPATLDTSNRHSVAIA